MNINKLTPELESLKPIVDQVTAILSQNGVTDYVSTVISNMKENAQLLAKNNVDAWIGYGAYLPAVERVIALNAGETEEDFYTRTQYPIHVVEAYTVPGDDLATLVAADQFYKMHRRLVPCTNTVWSLNDDEQHFINLDEYENRLKYV
ncbi:hypothetical protein DJ533_00295 (plasmid) [Acinetobacter defluvii]|uniref:Uncharacterized protein n=1 Tax=Acinetobacter defluvii TaxID=1871111 RepID=A0A2S2F8C6_9GAMM|nr:hypothetical protein [Acinetobacter defluvii]AWL27158.1 hypothetical protein DJ533_00295 [Acinetobacter defluvii]